MRATIARAKRAPASIPRVAPCSTRAIGGVRARSLRRAFPLTCRAHVTSLYHMPKMIQLRHVPDALHRKLKARAAMCGLPLSDYLIREARKLAEQPTPEEMRERLAQREPYRGSRSPTEVVRAERDGR